MPSVSPSFARRQTPRNVAAIAGLILGVVTACGVSAETTTSGVSTSTSTAPTTSSVPTTTTSPAPADVQASIDWFVSILNGEELTEAEYESRFSEEFRRQVPYESGFQPVLDQFRPDGPYNVVDRDGDMTSGEAVIESAGGIRARILAELDEGNRFSGLVIQPAEEHALDDPPETIEESFSRLAAMGTLHALAAEVVDGDCQVIEEVGASEPAPIGSMFKLYVLAALGEAVQNEDASWDDAIVIMDELKSVPTGVLQDRAAGETVTVQEAAELMISISDNTATDHLMDLLGRETVEAALAEYGNTTPELNTPLLNTRELTALKVGPASGLSVQWLDGDVAARRSILAQISDITPGDLPLQDWTDPIQPDQLEWFATPEDLCTLAVRLGELSRSVPEIGDILSANPGVPANVGTWDTIWFKGGSEPGLLAAWFVTRSEGGTYLTTGSVVNSDESVDIEEATLLFASARDLLATR